MTAEAAMIWREWSWEPSVIVGCLVLAGLYLGAAGPWRRRLQAAAGLAEAPISSGKVAWFLGGLAVAALALLSPLDELGDTYLFSAHMLQHLLLVLGAAPMLLLGTPGWMLAPLLRRPAVRGAGRWLTHPVPAFLIFNINFIAWHFPALYQATLVNENIHILEHLLFLATAVLNWWPVLGPAQELPRLPYAGQMLYLFLEAIPGTVLGALFVFADGPLYPFYIAAAHPFGLSAETDQQLSGLLMGTLSSLVYLAALGGVFMAWLEQEERGTLGTNPQDISPLRR
jgi:cytochrome c oxidase assembly factor CtaG